MGGQILGASIDDFTPSVFNKLASDHARTLQMGSGERNDKMAEARNMFRQARLCRFIISSDYVVVQDDNNGDSVQTSNDGSTNMNGEGTVITDHSPLSFVAKVSDREYRFDDARWVFRKNKTKKKQVAKHV